MPPDYERIANSYITHILVAVSVGDRAAPFRDFVDNWYAFKAPGGHLLTKGNLPRWFNNPNATILGDALTAMHFRSSKAAEIIALARDNNTEYEDRLAKKDASVRLMVDHAIPLRVIKNKLFTQEAKHTAETIHAVLCQWYRLGVITAEEDKRLNEAGLQSKMPPNWNETDVFARYQQVGIEPIKP
jgi:hypothetical protein